MDFKLTLLESEAMEWLLQGDEPVLEALRQQFSLARILSRELTGYGFYLNFEIPPGVKGLDELHVKPRFYLGDVEAHVDSLERVVGFLLWIKNGKLDFLEGHTIDERWPTQITKFEMRYLGGEREWKSLRQQWEIDDK